jgi:shikimate kinase
MQADAGNVILIGMPGAGKSTVGVVLAKRLGFAFVDVDLEIQSRSGRRLQQIIDSDGLAAFRALEEATLLDLAASITRSVIATGGSAVYSDAGMEALQRSGTMVFLDTPLALLESRISDMDHRGLVIDPGESFADLYARRLPLYRRWAEVTANGAGKNVEALAAEIELRLSEAVERR